MEFYIAYTGHERNARKLLLDGRIVDAKSKENRKVNKTTGKMIDLYPPIQQSEPAAAGNSICVSRKTIHHDWSADRRAILPGHRLRKEKLSCQKIQYHQVEPGTGVCIVQRQFIRASKATRLFCPE